MNSSNSVSGESGDLICANGDLEGNLSLQSFRQIGFGALGLQLVLLILWSNLQSERFSLTSDFSVYHQAWWLIGHGDLNPFTTLNGFPFWANHGEFIMWPMAILGWLWPHAVTLLWVQDVCIVGAEAVAFSWLCDFAGSTRSRGSGTSTSILLAGSGLILLMANPWLYWTAAFDFHMEIVGIFFIMLMARDLYRDPSRKRIWIWVVLALACGDVSATYMVGIGLSSMLAGSRWRSKGLALVGTGLGWVLLLSFFNANRGSVLPDGYGYLANNIGPINPNDFGVVQILSGIVHNPARSISVLWSRRIDIYAILSSGGLIGIFSVWALIPALIVLLENGLNSYVGFIVPSFQDALLFMLLPVGSIAVLSSLSKRSPRLIAVAATALAAITFGWGSIWIPRTEVQWLDVTPSAAKVLSTISKLIPARDEVVVSQGVAGPLSGRKWIYAIGAPSRFLARTSPTWVIVAPSQGIELIATATSDAIIGELAGPLHAKLIAQDAGIWAFRWMPHKIASYLLQPSVTTKIDAWTTVGPAGQSILHGPPSSWYAASNGSRGYVISGDYWRIPPAVYTASVSLSTSVAVDVEVWNATAGEMLTRREVMPSRGKLMLELPVDARQSFPSLLYTGANIFRISPTPPPPGNQLEIRIWSPGGGRVVVRSLSLTLANS